MLKGLVVVLAPVIDIPFQLGHYAVNEYNLMFVFMVFGRMFFQFVRFGKLSESILKLYFVVDFCLLSMPSICWCLA